MASILVGVVLVIHCAEDPINGLEKRMAELTFGFTWNFGTPQ